jgi:hypothetical protein
LRRMMDARVKPGHDEWESSRRSATRQPPATRTGIVAGCLRIRAQAIRTRSSGHVDKFCGRDIVATPGPRSIETRGRTAKNVSGAVTKPKAASATLRSIKVRRLDDAGQP